GGALKQVVDGSLAQPPIWRASAYCDVENPASARVMEKAGMTTKASSAAGTCAPPSAPSRAIA
ncbi:MAG TPA: GNAT family N-acetyltransferase, partial [Opitutaceae bacterium]